MNVIIVNKGIIMKKILYFSVCILLLFFSLYLFAYKKEISFTINSSEIILKIPPALIVGFFHNFEIEIISENKDDYLKILYNSFDRPLLFLPNKKNNSMLVVYFFDIEDHIFIIEKNENIMFQDFSNREKNSLSRILLLVKGFNIRPLTEFELNDAIKEIDAMPLEQYRDLSVPSLDLGFHKIYMPKSKILDMLQEEKIKLHRRIGQ